jgi:nucleoside-diphosphate-sugar epimerase
VEYVVGDVNDYGALQEAARGQEAIAHLAGIRSPFGAPGPTVFSVNTSGTFNAFQAAAAHGIRRVACASSICALGYHFGAKEFDPDSFPLDEEHPTFTTDPYSFSKQLVEEIAAYFWRREGISSVCLRLAWVYDLSEATRARVRESVAYLHQEVEALKVAPQAEREARLGRFFEKADVVRRSYTQERPAGGWNWQQAGMSAVELFAIFLRSDFWACIHPEDAGQAFEKSLLAGLEGSHVLHVNDSQNIAGVEAELLARTFFPRVQRRKRPLQGSEALVSIDKARTLIGFEPEHSIREFR